MILLDLTPEQWIKRYSSLQITQATCRDCGNKLFSTIPFISKEYIGLTSPPCPCGSMTKTECAICKILKSKKDQLSWDHVLGRESC